MRPKKSLFFLGLLLFSQSNFAFGDFGNWFVANKRLSNPIDSTSKKVSYRFTCQEDMTLNSAALFCLAATAPPAYLVSLQEDNNGLPSGTPLASNSYVPLASKWSTIPLDPVPLLKGKVYYLVVEQDTLRGGGHPVGVIGPSNQASFLSTDVLNRIHPNDGSPDLKANTLFFENGKWRELDQEPVYAVFGTGSKYQGNPYDDPGERPVFQKMQQGQSLHFHCGYTMTNLAFRVRKQGNPTAPLKYSILVNDYRQHKCNPVYSDIAVPAGQVSTNYQWVTIGLPIQIQKLFRAECWFFVFQTDSGRPSTDKAGCEDCYLLSDEGNSGGLARAGDMTFDGGPHLSRAVSSKDGGDPFHWMDDFERDSNVGAIGPPCPAPYGQEFKPLPTPASLENELRYEP